ncbi:receptor kinase-like protein Xa21 [Oryza brachyantha]|uniref:receptor kinase-like protein Xa21 n=1 Tax=Oryza brachyantha TaxID=4533 RepID=UPI0003EA8AB8|nr:receptor kinase-like protein Xa21 [Oryza brachyantha]
MLHHPPVRRTLGSSQLLAIAAALSSLLSFATFPAISVAQTAPNNGSSTDLQALLCLKLHLSSTATAGSLASWRTRNDSSLDFCSWPGVSCSKTQPSRVAALDLESSGLDGRLPPCVANLTSLTRIHLPNNQLGGQIPPEIGQLTMLSYLNLSSNKFSGMILETLSSPNLRAVDLGRNSLQGDIPPNLSRCSGLEKLNLESNMITGGIPEGLGMLRNLSVLRLADNSLTGKIPLSLGSTNSLVYVQITNNSLTGPVPSALAECSLLQVLDLTKNNLSGEIPPALFNSTSLLRLSLGKNNFDGPIPAFSNVDPPLQYLRLSENNLGGTIPSSLENYSSLRWLLLQGNYFVGSIPVSLGSIPNLQVLDLSYNFELAGTVPATIFNISSLTYLNLAVNNFTGDIPSDAGHTLQSIRSLNFQENQLQGPIPPSLANATNLQYLNLGANAFSGTVPSFGSLANLTTLILASNQLEAGDWSFFSSLTNCTQLNILSLWKNKMQGNLPSSVGSLANSLEVLFMRENKISGTIPAEIGKLRNLRFLRMEHNLFEGNIPGSLGDLTKLGELSLSNNKLSGQIPMSIGKLHQLTELDLQENNLSGPIPRSIGDCKSLNTLNLSYNSLNGSIPKELFSLYSLTRGLDLSHNQLSGQILQEIGNLINVGYLNFSNNRLFGLIPNNLGSCVHLESLHMEGNFLDGRIPNSFINLKSISEIDLSRNNLSGEIPEFFQSFNSLKLLNLSFNNLEGQMPTGGIFQNSSEVFVQGNSMLCSNSPKLHLPLCSGSTSKHRRTSRDLKIVGLSVALALISLSCVILIVFKRRKRTKQSDHLSCKEWKKFSYSDLVKATNGFSSDNLVGSGAYGSVYKGVLESKPHTIAIKVFKLDQLGAPKSFLAECEAFRNTRHRNLVRVISACSTWDHNGNDFKALIVEYMANGNLEGLLYSKMGRTLSLGARISIAADIASALDYLHNRCTPPIVHCDLKPNNILLDDLMGGRLGDFGLSKFLHSYSSSSITSSTSLAGPRGSIGYIAPEYGFGSKISTEGDVYSYGIIILEMLTRKRPTDEMFSNGLSLHTYVGNAFPQQIGEVLDPDIVPNLEDEHMVKQLDCENDATEGALSCITQLVKLGLSCSVETPKDRPTMLDVYAEITRIKQAFLALHG